MYKGFDLALSRDRMQRFFECNHIAWETMVEQGAAEKGRSMSRIKEAAANGLFVIDGDDAEGNNFPIAPCHVFISHSHDDADVALAVRYALRRWCGLDVFVDSVIWENFKILSAEMYRKILTARKISSVAAKQKVWDQVVTHSHCMLTKSLVEMMDQCECLIFLNTPNSIQITDGGDSTCSPWIHTELEMSHFLREKTDDRRVQPVLESRQFAFDEDDTRNVVRYLADKSNLTALDGGQFVQWICDASKLPKHGEVELFAFRALDLLYDKQ